MPTLYTSTTPPSTPAIAPTAFPRRARLPLKPGRLWKIERGVVRALSWMDDGTVVPLGMWGPGDIVGHLCAQTTPYEIEALTEVAAEAIALETCSTLPDVLCDHLRQAQELITIRAGRRADDTLLKVLSWLSQKFGAEVKNGYLINFNVTHQDLAELSGLTRVTVTRSLSYLEQQGVIQRLSRQLVVTRDLEVWHYEI